MSTDPDNGDARTGVGYMECSPTDLPAGVRAIVTRVPTDLREPRWREVLTRELSLQRLQCLSQVHGCAVVQAQQGVAAAEPQADGVWTRAPGLGCGILTADCLPVVLAAADGSVVAAAHAGWRGLAAGVLEATLAAMPVPAEQCRAWLGPAIGQASFEVGPEVLAAFMEAAEEGAGSIDGVTAAFERGQGDRWHADLYALARTRLQAAGVGRIAGGGWDTRRDPQWHSFRRDGAAAGRQLTLVWRAG